MPQLQRENPMALMLLTLPLLEARRYLEAKRLINVEPVSVLLPTLALGRGPGVLFLRLNLFYLWLLSLSLLLHCYLYPAPHNLLR